jgi:hypothetical protein
LKSDSGICHELFTGEEEEEAEVVEDEEDEEAAATQANTQADILKTFKHKFVEEVVCEPKMHYWNVPRLGSFMAIPFVYKSCLSESSLDSALLDYIEVLKRNEVQDAEIAEWNEEQEAVKEDKLKAGEKFYPEDKEWEDIKTNSFMTSDEKFVLCIDTLGQDRKLSDEQRKFCLETTLKFIKTWEQSETSQLEQDRNQRLQTNIEDAEFFKEHGDKLKDDEDLYVEEQF